MGMSAFSFLIATKEKYAQHPKPIGITGARARKCKSTTELFSREFIPPAVEVEARNNPIMDTIIPTTERDSCFLDKFGFSKISIIRKKITDANDTNEKTTKT